MRNILRSLDLFAENIQPSVLNLREGIRHFVAITAHASSDKNKLVITQYELTGKPSDVINADTDLVSYFEIDYDSLDNNCQGNWTFH
jgi:hypothetical protein